MNLDIGYVKSSKKIITSKEVIRFAKISGDINPIHIDSEYANKTIFKQRIVHGMHSVSLISGLLSSVFEGFDCVYVSQSIKFIKPIYINEEITIKAVLNEIKRSKSLYVFNTICEVRGDIALEGQAEILCLSRIKYPYHV